MERTPSEAPEESPTPRIMREQRMGVHIEIAFIDALRLTVRKLRKLYRIKSKPK